MTQAIKLTLPNSLAKETKENAKLFGYYNVQELIQEAIRNINKTLLRQKALKNLERLKGTSKGKSPSEKERQRIFLEFESEVLRKHNLD